MLTQSRQELLQSLQEGCSPCHQPERLLSQEAWLRREALWIAALDWCLRSGCALETKYRNEHLEAVGWELSIRATMKELGQAAQARGIRVLVFKGCALSLRYYCYPGQRSYGDIDLAVGPEDRAGFESLLSELGFSPPVGTMYYRGGLALDLHHHPLHQLSLDLQLGPKPWAQSLERLPDDYGAAFILPPEQEFILTLFHGAKHAFSRANWVADLWLLSQKLAPKELAEVVVSQQAGRHLWLARQCLKQWFAADFPEELNRVATPPSRLDIISRLLVRQILKRRAPDFVGMLTPLWALQGWRSKWTYFWRALAPAPGEELRQKVWRLANTLRRP